MSWKASGYIKELTVSPQGHAISRTEKLLLMVLADSYNNDRGYAHPSIPTLTRQCLMSDRTVQRCLRSLEAKGLISTIRGGGIGRSSRYTILGVERVKGDAVSVFNQLKVTPVTENPDITMSPERELAVIIERDAHTNTYKRKEEELHLEQDLLPWMESVWRKHPNCRRRKWEAPKFPSSFERTEEFEGPAKFPQAFLGYLETADKPNVIDFLYSRPKPPRNTYPGRRRPTAEEITGKSDVQRLRELLGRTS